MKKNKLIVVVLVMLFILTSLNVFAQEGDLDLLNQSMKNYHINNFEKALQLNKQINLNKLKTSAKVDALYYRTLIELRLGNVLEAKKQMEMLFDMGYEFGRLHYELAKVYLNTYNNFDSAYYQSALEEFKQARSLGMNSAQFHRDYALAYMGLNNHHKAILQLELAILENGNMGDYLNLGNLYKELGNLEEANKSYQKVLKKDQNNVTAYSEIGNILIKQAKYEEAARILRQGVQLDPDSFILNYKLGEAYYNTQEWALAKSYLNKTIDLKNNYYLAYYHLGKISEHQKNYQEARYYLNECIKYNPDYYWAFIALGDVSLKEENNYQAIAHYSAAIEKSPNYPTGHFHLALAYNQAGMQNSAISELKRTLHLSDSHPEAQQLLNKLTEE